MIKGTEESNDEAAARSRLSERLKSWSGIEPRADFADEVWARIRNEPETLSPAFLLAGIRVPMLWANALAAMLGLAVGMGAGLMSLSGRHVSSDDNPLLKPDTVAGSYLAMLSGGGR